VRVIDLFREWDEDGSGTVSKKEFRKAMPMLGLQLPEKEVALSP
jgi:Ca2+-binding EF-hand superfamily protein